jgi:hypothetical protein
MQALSRNKYVLEAISLSYIYTIFVVHVEKIAFSLKAKGKSVKYVCRISTKCKLFHGINMLEATKLSYIFTFFIEHLEIFFSLKAKFANSCFPSMRNLRNVGTFFAF